MPDTTPRRIATEPPPRHRPLWLQTVFGLLFLAASLAMASAILGKIYSYPPDSKYRQNLWMPIGFLSLFPVVALFFVVPGIASILRARRARRLAAAHPDEPWLADYPWSRGGYRERIGAWFAWRIGTLLVIELVLAPFHYWMWTAPTWALGLLLGVADLVVLLLVGWMAVRAARKLRYGASFVKYERFPFFLGETVRVRVGTDKPMPAGVPLEATLRAVEERLPTTPGVNRLDLFQVCAETRTVAFDDATREIAIELSLPADAPATELDRPCRRWWEIHLQATRPGLDYDETVMVPVYRRFR